MNLGPTTHTRVNSSRQANESRASEDTLAPKSQVPSPPQGIDPQGIDADILSAMWGEDSPLTLRQLRRKTGIPVELLAEAIAGLRSAGRISRLNTIIESYVPRPAVEERIFTPSLPLPHPSSTTGSDTHYNGYTLV